MNKILVIILIIFSTTTYSQFTKKKQYAHAKHNAYACTSTDKLEHFEKVRHHKNKKEMNSYLKKNYCVILPPGAKVELRGHHYHNKTRMFVWNGVRYWSDQEVLDTRI